MMNLTDKHHQLAQRIDAYVNGVVKKGGDDAQIMQGMVDYMNSFKQLIDMSPNGELDLLVNQYDGLYKFAKLLENLAQGIREGRINPDDF